MKRRTFLEGSAALAGFSQISGAAIASPNDCEAPLRIWGHGALGKRLEFVEGLVGRWQEAYLRYSPAAVFEDHLNGTAAAIGALYTGRGELAFMGREIWAPELAAFREVRGYDVTGVEVMTGSLATRNKGYAIAMFVHRDNPIRGLSIDQIDAVFSVERRRRHAPVAKWADLGVGGELGKTKINLYGFPIARGFAQFMEDRVFAGSTIWKPELNEFPDDRNSLSVETDGGLRMLRALADDPAGLAYAGLMYANEGVRAIPVSETAAGPFVLPTLQSVQDRTYPLVRIISMFLDLPPAGGGHRQAIDFVRFILGPEGQSIVSEHGGGYLPLTAANAREQLAKLER